MRFIPVSHLYPSSYASSSPSPSPPQPALRKLCPRPADAGMLHFAPVVYRRRRPRCCPLPQTEEERGMARAPLPTQPRLPHPPAIAAHNTHAGKPSPQRDHVLHLPAMPHDIITLDSSSGEETETRGCIAPPSLKFYKRRHRPPRTWTDCPGQHQISEACIKEGIMANDAGSTENALQRGVASSSGHRWNSEVCINDGVAENDEGNTENVLEPEFTMAAAMETSDSGCSMDKLAAKSGHPIDEGTANHIHLNSFSSSIDPITAHDVLSRESSLIPQTPCQISTYDEPTSWVVEEIQTNLQADNGLFAETRTEQGVNMSEQDVNMDTTKAESQPKRLPARKKRKMQRVKEFTEVEDVLHDSPHPETGHPCMPSKVPQNLSLNASAQRRHTSSQQRQWKSVNVTAADSTLLVGQTCRVYWPLEYSWFSGVIHSYNTSTGKHHIKYEDGDTEDLILADECVKLYISFDEMLALNLQLDIEVGGEKKVEYDETTMSAATEFEDSCQSFKHGDVAWAKMKGHPMWPAIIMDEKHADACGLDIYAREGSIPVQFFGSYDYASVSVKHIVPFSRGFVQKFQFKCKRLAFERSLKEADRYLKQHRLPNGMSKLQDEAASLVPQVENVENESSEVDDDSMNDKILLQERNGGDRFTCPIKLGSLKVLSLGRIVQDSEHFHNERHIWTEGYTAVRKFASVKDPRRLVYYKMEVMKNPSIKGMPLFRVTPDDSDQVEGSSPSFCWKTIFLRLHKARKKYGLINFHRPHKSSGIFMFGLSNRRVLELIQGLPNARVCSKFTQWVDMRIKEQSQDLLPAGYSPVRIEWKHPDRCNVCYLDEEYANNMFLQCDKCRILVHMHCYGESELPDGHLWLCKLCRPGAPARNPPCCLCPVEGGAMKITSDGRWAHLACALWIPETCLIDIKQMEPIDGLSCIKKDRWKLICSICRVPYGVCIQCSELSCYVAYHILCARAAGLVTEVQEEFNKDKLFCEEHEEPVRLLSYCKKHRQPKEQIGSLAPNYEGSHSNGQNCSAYNNAHNVSGCARCEPFDSTARRGRQEPEALAAAAAKRLYVERMPYLVSGIHRKERIFPSLQGINSQIAYANGLDCKTRYSSIDTDAPLATDSASIFSMSERYKHMRATVHQRLTFGKSGIHGWGIFTRKQHYAGDMIIEYAGEIVRPIVADIREQYFYNSLVGAGTYMFRIDDDRVVDATRAGSVAHLINHACEPNCYSRVISVAGEEHIIIFAKRNIKEGEELAYDYRFTSKGEKLACYCGFPRCRGSVNIYDADEDQIKFCVPRSALSEWIFTD